MQRKSALDLGLQPPAGPQPVDGTANVELQKISPIMTRMAGLLSGRAYKACGSKIEVVNEGHDETDRVVRAEIIIQHVRQKKQLRAICS